MSFNHQSCRDDEFTLSLPKCYSLFFESIMSVTGPSFTSNTFISAPKTPASTFICDCCFNSRRKYSYSGIACSGRAVHACGDKANRVCVIAAGGLGGAHLQHSAVVPAQLADQACDSLAKEGPEAGKAKKGIRSSGETTGAILRAPFFCSMRDEERPCRAS